MVELVDRSALEAEAERRESSNLSRSTDFKLGDIMGNFYYGGQGGACGGGGNSSITGGGAGWGSYTPYQTQTVQIYTTDTCNRSFPVACEIEKEDTPERVKCGHCAQWGVEKTMCLHCGAPIDPPEKQEIKSRWMGEDIDEEDGFWGEPAPKSLTNPWSELGVSADEASKSMSLFAKMFSKRK
jgi:hypothetical protein